MENKKLKYSSLNRTIDQITGRSEMRHLLSPQESRRDKTIEYLINLPDDAKHEAIIGLCRKFIKQNILLDELKTIIRQYCEETIIKIENSALPIQIEPFTYLKKINQLDQSAKIELLFDWLTKLPIMRFYEYINHNQDFFVCPTTIRRYFIDDLENRNKLTTKNCLNKISIPIEKLYSYLKDLEEQEYVTKNWPTLDGLQKFHQVKNCTIKEWVRFGVIDNKYLKLIKSHYYVEPKYYKTITQIYSIDKANDFLKLGLPQIRGLIIGGKMQTMMFNNQIFLPIEEVQKIMQDQIYYPQKYKSIDKYYSIEETNKILKVTNNIVCRYCQKGLIKHHRLKVNNIEMIFISQNEISRLLSENYFEVTKKNSTNREIIEKNPQDYLSLQKAAQFCGISFRVIQDAHFKGEIPTLSIGQMGKGKESVYIHCHDAAALKDRINKGEVFSQARSINIKKNIIQNNPEKLNDFYHHHKNIDQITQLLGVARWNMEKLFEKDTELKGKLILFDNLSFLPNKDLLVLFANKQKIFPTISSRLTSLIDIENLNHDDIHNQIIFDAYSFLLKNQPPCIAKITRQKITNQLGNKQNFCVKDLEEILLLKIRSFEKRFSLDSFIGQERLRANCNLTNLEMRQIVESWCSVIPTNKLANFIHWHPDIPGSRYSIYDLLVKKKLNNEMDLFPDQVVDILEHFSKIQKKINLWIEKKDLSAFLPKLPIDFNQWIKKEKLQIDIDYEVISHRTFFNLAKILEIYQKYFPEPISI